jgi:hypothetical protein
MHTDGYDGWQRGDGEAVDTAVVVPGGAVTGGDAAAAPPNEQAFQAPALVAFARLAAA